MRVRAEFFDRTSVYMQGVLSLEEVLRAFHTLGKVFKMEVYIKGKRKLVWISPGGWIIR